MGYLNNHIFIPMVSGGMIGHVMFAIQGGMFLSAQWEALGTFRAFWDVWSVMVIFWLVSCVLL